MSSPPENPNDQQLKFTRLVIVGTFLTLVVGIINNFESLLKSTIWNVFFKVIDKISGGYVWFVICIIISTTTILILICIWKGKLNPVPDIYEYYKSSRLWFFLKILFSCPIIFLMNILILTIFFQNAFHSIEAELLFPQAIKIGPTLISTYASRGKVEYSFIKEKPFNYAKIKLQTYGRTVEENCGWVIFLLKGSDVSNYKAISFYIRGENGEEKIGFKAKDARGIENYLLLEEDGYLPEKKIKTTWQKVSIPLKDFGDVNINLMDNFSIFQRGDFVGTRSQTICLANFELE